MPSSEGSDDVEVEVEKWRYCKDCKGLAFVGDTQGDCSAGEKHTLDKSEFYILAPFPDATTEPSDEKTEPSKEMTEPSEEETKSPEGRTEPPEDRVWKHCSKCQLIALDSWNACSGGGAHVSVDSPCYTLIYAADRHGSPDGEHGWNICSGCYCLVYNSEGTLGDGKACPAGEKHELFHDKDYIVKIKKTQPELLQDGWAKCSHCAVLHRSTGEFGDCLEREGEKHSSRGSKNYWLLCAKSDQELVNGGYEWRERTAIDPAPGFDGW